MVAIADSGVGLDAGTLDRLFDAFYANKPASMGIGLTISRSIIDAHGGRAWAAPNTPRGAVFRFTLPASRGLMAALVVLEQHVVGPATVEIRSKGHSRMSNQVMI